MLDLLYVTNNIQSALDELRRLDTVQKLNRCRLTGKLKDERTFRILHADSYAIRGIQIKQWMRLGECSLTPSQKRLLDSRIR